ncbi:MAG: HD domain-containing protein [Oligoflexia bacterium]|nr:HD domain-containing protein [Oligoflexia bacterium]MBF0366814.1 HD domain-containing protein [Oligoflexia bacterium]
MKANKHAGIRVNEKESGNSDNNSNKENNVRLVSENVAKPPSTDEEKDTLILNLNVKIKRYDGLIKFGELISAAALAKRADKEVYKRGTTKLKELLECEAVHIYQIDKEKNEVFYEYKLNDPAAANSKGKAAKRRVSYKIDEHSLPGSCAYYMATLHIPNVVSDLRYKRHEQEMDASSILFKGMLLAPLVVEGEILGVIQAINSFRGLFNSEDVHFIQAVANQMGLILQYLAAVERAKKQLFQVSQAFANAIDLKDRYTGGHTRRVAHFAEVIAREMNLSQEELDEVRLAGILHDIGKIGVDDAILRKQAQLTREEFEKMKQHPHLGYEILGNIDGLKRVVDGVRYHHERPDGRGYPYGLKGENISTIAQIISVADTFDAIISNRPYRKGLPPMRAYREIVQYRGKQFKKEVVDAFERVFKKSLMYKQEDDTGEGVTTSSEIQAIPAIKDVAEETNTMSFSTNSELCLPAMGFAEDSEKKDQSMQEDAKKILPLNIADTKGTKANSPAKENSSDNNNKKSIAAKK